MYHIPGSIHTSDYSVIQVYWYSVDPYLLLTLYGEPRLAINYECNYYWWELQVVSYLHGSSLCLNGQE